MVKLPHICDERRKTCQGVIGDCVRLIFAEPPIIFSFGNTLLRKSLADDGARCGPTGCIQIKKYGCCLSTAGADSLAV